MTKNLASLTFIVLLTALSLYFCFILLIPFLKPIFFAGVLAILFYPLHVHLRRKVHSSDLAAGLSTSVVILLISTISVFLVRALLLGLSDTYQSFGVAQGANERLSVYLVALVERTLEFTSRYLPISIPDLRGTVQTQIENAVAALLRVTAGAVGGITLLVFNSLITFFTLFFFLRDGRSTLRRLAVLLPLKKSQVSKLYACIRETLRAILYGTMAIATIQGALTGIAFWILGLASPVLWAVVTALCALLPVIGTTFVFLPAICMLLFSGHWVKALILLAWGLLLVHPVDNVLRPYLIGERTKLSTLFVFFALLGGLQVFGGLGVLLGPVILAVTMALFDFLREERSFFDPVRTAS
jgi:predicted PurR-regulated permease PerM